MVLGIFILLSLSIKLFLIFEYKNRLTLSSDDINYIKSAIVLLKKGIFTFQNVNEPTVFVMPLYPFFLAFIFKIFGFGFIGLQAVRIIQAVFSCVTILLVYFTAKKLFDYRTAILSAFFTAFYIPNITTAGYMLTETLFTMLLIFLIFLSLQFTNEPSIPKFTVLGGLWALVTLCRPTVALYPVLLAAYGYFYRRMRVYRMLKLFLAMLMSFTIVMLPWWIRNFKEYGEFIPLAISSGNPMLQGTYIDYVQNADNIVYYKLGKNAIETNNNEVGAAKLRIKKGFQEDFWDYLEWYTVKKTVLYWCGAFYWQEVFGISKYVALAFHYVLLLGIPGILILTFRNFTRYILPVSVMVYFNAVHCVYMAFDRYAFPMMTLMSMFSAFFIIRVLSIFRDL